MKICSLVVNVTWNIHLLTSHSTFSSNTHTTSEWLARTFVISVQTGPDHQAFKCWISKSYWILRLNSWIYFKWNTGIFLGWKNTGIICVHKTRAVVIIYVLWYLSVVSVVVTKCWLKSVIFSFSKNPSLTTGCTYQSKPSTWCSLVSCLGK